MIYFAVKVLISALLIALVSEISRRHALIGSLLASLPLVTVLAMIWLYVDTGDTERIAQFSLGVFWMVLPSLSLVLLLPLLLRHGLGFFPALGVSIAVMIGLYSGMLVVLRKFGIAL